MSEFVAALHAQVDQARHGLDQAQRADDAGQVHRYGARLLDLLDRAANHGVDTTGWVPQATLAVAATAAGDRT